MKIAVDFDDVLSDFAGFMIDAVREEQGRVLTRESFKTYNLLETLSMTEQGLYDLLQNTRPLVNMKPIAGSQEAVEILRGKYDLVVVTNRPEDNIPKIGNWLNRYFPRSFSEILSTKTRTETKKMICSRINAYALIDDYIFNFLGLRGTRSLLFEDWPYSRFEARDVLGVFSHLERVKDWEEVVKKLM